MSSRMLVIGEIARPLVRRTRREDGKVFGVLTIRDYDRGEARLWTAYVNGVDLIEAIERLRAGEPVGATGPFSMRLSGSGETADIEYRLTINALVDTRPRKPKTKTQVKAEQKVASDELDQAPKAQEGGFDFDDEIPL